MGSLIRPLLEEIIDFAGLFPPAKQSMAEAVAAYRGYRHGREAWIVNRFLCPAGRLAELGDLLEKLSGAFGPVGVIGTGGIDLDAWETALEADAKAMTAFENRLGDQAPIEGFEIRRPEGPLTPVLADLRAFDSIDVFLELPWGERQAEELAAIAETEWLGAKARTGGLEAAAFPSSKDLAGFLKGAQDLEVPFKLTAGLHQPLRHFDAEIGAWHHGFLNVLAALRLGEDADLSADEMAAVLEAESLSWGDGRLVWEAIEVGDPGWVRDIFRGFGTCSIDEPVDGLAALGLEWEVLA